MLESKVGGRWLDKQETKKKVEVVQQDTSSKVQWKLEVRFYLREIVEQCKDKKKKSERRRARW